MRKFIGETLETILIALVLAFFIRGYVVESFMVEGTSMVPTLHNRERLLVNKFVYRLRAPRTGDIVVFRYPVNPRRDFIKRVAGVGGESVEIVGGRLFVDGTPVDEPYLLNRGNGDFPLTKVPPGYLFVLGDNRTNSEDSRYFGFVPLGYVKGEAFLVWWQPSHARVLP